MSFIGTLEYINLATVLQRIEILSKTGLLLVKHEEQKVELYFRDGLLMYIASVRSDISLGDRLLQSGVISTQALQETISIVGIAHPEETHIALILMDLGHVSHEELRSWATKEAREVILALLRWQGGEIYFEEGQQPPADRLLVAHSPTSLLPSTSTPSRPPSAPTSSSPKTPNETPSTPVEEQHRAGLIATPPTQTSALYSTTIDDKPPSILSFAPPNLDVYSSSAPPITPPQRVNVPPSLKRIDTSFMQPEMVLLPSDLSALRDQNVYVQITPDQWRLLTMVDGLTSLRKACQDLLLPREQVYQVAGQMITQGLLLLVHPTQIQVSELSQVSLEDFEPKEQEPQKVELHEKSPNALFALARISLENNNKAYVDKVYTIEAGISLGNAENLSTSWPTSLSSNMNNPVQFDIVLHTSENIALVTNWHGHLLYDPYSLETQLINFKFSVIEIGPSSITLDFYYQLQWLKTVRLEFESVAKPQLTAVVS